MCLAYGSAQALHLGTSAIFINRGLVLQAQCIVVRAGEFPLLVELICSIDNIQVSSSPSFSGDVMKWLLGRRTVGVHSVELDRKVTALRLIIRFGSNVSCHLWPLPLCYS